MKCLLNEPRSSSSFKRHLKYRNLIFTLFLLTVSVTSVTKAQTNDRESVTGKSSAGDIWVTRYGCPEKTNLLPTEHYYISARLFKWETAKSVCEFLGGVLVTLETSSERYFLQKNVPNTDICYWTSLYQSSSRRPWVWQDGSTPSVLSWADGFPQNKDALKDTCYEYTASLACTNFEITQSWWNDNRFEPHGLVCEIKDGCSTQPCSGSDYPHCVSDMRGGYHCEKNITRDITTPDSQPTTDSTDESASDYRTIVSDDTLYIALQTTAFSKNAPTDPESRPKYCITLNEWKTILVVVFFPLALFIMLICYCCYKHCKKDKNNSKADKYNKSHGTNVDLLTDTLLLP